MSLKKKDIDKKLRENVHTEKIQKEKEAILNRQKQLTNDYNSREKEIMAKISEEGYLPFGELIISETKKLLEDKRKKGIVPSNIKYGFLEDLLHGKECICERPLIKGEAPYKAVEKQMKPEATDKYEDAVIQAGQAAATLEDARKRFPKELGKLCELKTKIQMELIKKGEELEEIKTKYADIDLETENEEKLIEQSNSTDSLLRDALRNQGSKKMN